MINAVDLRNKKELKRIDNKPGYYKWWANKSELNFILDKLSVKFETVESAIEEKDGLFCIYVGIAVKESVRDRLDWHVNDKHSEAQVRNGTLSTLRQSISSLVSQNQYDKKGTNDFIDKLKIEYFLNDNPIKSVMANTELHDFERMLLLKNLYVLNIQENHHPFAELTKTELRRLRKISK